MTLPRRSVLPLRWQQRRLWRRRCGRVYVAHYGLGGYRRVARRRARSLQPAREPVVNRWSNCFPVVLTNHDFIIIHSG